MLGKVLFHTYWDFRIESIAWKTHTEIFSSNHNRENTFSHVGKAVSSYQNSAGRMNQSVRKRVHVAFWRLFNLHSQKFVEFPRFTQVFSKICHKPQTKFEQVYRLDKPIKKYIQEEQSRNTRTKTRWDAGLAWPLETFRSVQFIRTVKTLHPSRTLPAKLKKYCKCR